MENSKLIRILSSFSDTELKEFNKFLSSPFFTTRTDVVLLYTGILEEKSKKNPNYLKEALYKRMYPEEVYTATKMDLVMSYLFRLLQQYIAQKELDQDTHRKELYILRGYRKKKLFKDFHQYQQSLTKKIDQQALRNIHYYNVLHQINFEQYLVSTDTKPTQTEELQALINNHDILYLANQLRYHCWYLSNQNVYPPNYQVQSIEAIIQRVETANYLNYPAINLYYHWYYMISHPEEEKYYFKFKQQLLELDKLFNNIEKRNLLLVSINYCIKRMNSGHKQYLEELFGLYQSGLTNGHLLDNGFLSRFTYQNIVATSIGVQNYQWANQFIHDYKTHLKKKERESTFNFNLARLAYHKKEYDTALPLLQKANYRDILLNLSAKTLLLKIYVELEEFDPLSAHLDAMQRYLRRKERLGYHKTNYQNLVKFTKKFIVLNPFDKAQIKAFYQEVLAIQILPEKTWFLEMLKDKFSLDSEMKEFN